MQVIYICRDSDQILDIDNNDHMIVRTPVHNNKKINNKKQTITEKS